MEKIIRRKFIFVSSSAVLLMIAIIIGLIVGIAYFTTYSRLFSEIDFIHENGDKIPNYEKSNGAKYENVKITPESEYELRYFTIEIDENSYIKEINISNVAAISENEASEIAIKVLNKRNKKGSIEKDSCKYVYKIKDKDDGKIIIFLDSTRTFGNLSQIVNMAFKIGTLSFLFFVILISLFSRKAVKSTVKNIEAQNEFITNAGHELKTPLAIISANAEVLEMMNGKNEWTQSIVNQVKRMSDLISDLIFLAKMNEKTDVVLSDIDFSKIANDISVSFKPVIEQQKKKFQCDIKEKVTIRGEEKLLSELVSILIDNAVKYCDEEGMIKVELKSKSRDTGAKLIVSNTYAEGANVDYSRFFNRFYREDTSHNSKKKGYGIGLSMAEGIIKILKGKISVSYSNGEISFVVTI